MARRYFLGYDISAEQLTVSLMQEDEGLVELCRSFSCEGLTGRPFSDVHSEFIACGSGLLDAEGVSEDSLLAVGVSASTQVDREKGMLLGVNDLSTWPKAPVCSVLSKAFGVDVFLQSSGDAALLAELFFGSEGFDEKVFYLSLKGDVEGSFFRNGQLMDSLSVDGEGIGHVCIDSDGPLCSCGRQGCVQLYCGRGYAEERLRQYLADLGPLVEGHWYTLKQERWRVGLKTLAKALQGDNEDAQHYRDNYVEWTAEACRILLGLYKPDKLLIGTVEGLGEEYFVDPLRMILGQKGETACHVSAASLGADVVLYSGVSVAMYYCGLREMKTPSKTRG